MRSEPNSVFMVELDMSGCSNQFGVLPCTAVGDPGFECFNTFNTCKDKGNFASELRQYKLISNQAFVNPDGTIPCLSKFPKITPAEIKQNRGIAIRGAMEFECTDFPYNDLLPGDDDYRDTRNYIARDTGTFWGKFLARFPYYQGATARLKLGAWEEQADGSYLDVYTDQFSFLLDRIDVQLNGIVKIRCTDPLAFLDDSNVKIPTPTDAVLLLDIAGNQSSNIPIEAAQVAYFSFPAANGYVRVNEEIIHFSGITGDALLNVTKGQFGTTPANHLTGDGITKLFGISAKNVVDALADLIINWGGVDPSLLAYDAVQTVPTGVPDIWDIELEQWLQSIDIYGVIHADSGLTKILNDICMQTGIVLWWNSTAGKIYINANKFRLAAEDQPLITDDHISEGTFGMKEERRAFISQVWTYYGLINPLRSIEPANFKNAHVGINSDLESGNALGKAQIVVKYANWLEAGSLGVVLTLSTRLLNESSFPRYRFSFSVHWEQWQDLRLGDYFYLQTRYLQSATGQVQIVRCRIVKIYPRRMDGQIVVNATAQTAVDDITLGRRYGDICPNTFLDYNDETLPNQAAYAFSSAEAGFDDGELPFLIT